MYILLGSGLIKFKIVVIIVDLIAHNILEVSIHRSDDISAACVLLFE